MKSFMICMIMTKRPGRLAAEDDLVDADHERAHVEALGHPGLEVARAIELVEEPALAEGLRIRLQPVARAARLERGGGRLGSHHSRLDRAVAALDARGVEEARVGADEGAPREDTSGGH